jgi:TP901 family phage tail tape measure protein
MMRFGVLLKAIDDFTGPVGKMIRDTQSLRATLKQSDQWAQWGKSMAAGAVAAGAVSASAVAALAAPVASYRNFEDALAAAHTVWTPVSESMGTSLGRLQAAAMEWSSSHRQSATEFVQAAYQMGSAGLNATQAIEGTRAALGLATAAFGGATEAAGLLAMTYNTMGDRLAPIDVEMQRIADILAKTQQLFQISNLNQLGEGLKYAIPAAQAAGQSLEDVAAAVGTLSTFGLQGSMAGTALASMMSRLASAGEMLGLKWHKTKCRMRLEVSGG